MCGIQFVKVFFPLTSQVSHRLTHRCAPNQCNIDNCSAAPCPEVDIGNDLQSSYCVRSKIIKTNVTQCSLFVNTQNLLLKSVTKVTLDKLARICFLYLEPSFDIERQYFLIKKGLKKQISVNNELDVFILGYGQDLGSSLNGVHFSDIVEIFAVKR